ncbi:uncharacterized protein LOC128510845 [Clarias gariepinus]|uniref:uncharacterized protein LOC128510845 n=1 Tax=Clarias gariepinus TaxID=13013 RepID=UPI00234CDACC|nr:uncharacterized protein LOC128510845 [Clarias gariepinus]
MWLLTLTSLLVYGSVHTAHGVLYYKTGTEGRGVTLDCKKAGSVTWSKGVPEGTRPILTVTPGGDTIKHNPDPDHRYSVLDDLSLMIRDLSLSDSGIYYCNTDTVYNLTVTPLQVLYYKTGTEGRDVSLYCRNDGSVTWSKGVSEGRCTILTVKPGGDTIKHNPDPDHRYSVLDDLSLYIRDLSLSDSGIYYCNTDTVYNLTVTPLQDVTSAVNNVTICSTAAPAGTTSHPSTPSGSETDSSGNSTEGLSTPTSTMKTTSDSTEGLSTPASTMKTTTDTTKSTETTHSMTTSKASVSQSSKPEQR